MRHQSTSETVTIIPHDANLKPVPSPYSKYAVCLSTHAVYNLATGRQVSAAYRGPYQRAFVNVYRDDSRPGHPERDTVQVAELVLRATQGPPKFEKYEVSHIDGNCQNNAPDNLRWESKSGNIKRHHEQFGNRGHRNPNAKIEYCFYIDIAEMVSQGLSYSEIARELKVSPSTISRHAKREGLASKR